MVCGSIGYGGIENIRRPYAVLTEKGFDATNHPLEKDRDYSHIYDFRDKLKLSQVIVENDLERMDNADVFVVVIINSPSYGTAMEMLIAKGKGRKIVSLAKDSVPTP